MLYPLIFPFFLLFFSGLGATCSQESRSCSVPLQGQLLTGDSLKIIEMMKSDIEFQSFLTESAQKRDAVLRDPEIQNFVSALQDQKLTQVLKHKSGPSNQAAELYLFVSFSLGEKALLNLAQEAKRWNATLVLRGFIEGSYAKTAKALQKIILKTGQGFIIDPELFSLFNVKTAPTYILTKPFQLDAQERAQTPLHDRIKGHASTHYALEQFAKEGGLREEAQVLLKHGGAE